MTTEEDLHTSDIVAGSANIANTPGMSTLSDGGDYDYFEENLIKRKRRPHRQRGVQANLDREGWIDIIKNNDALYFISLTVFAIVGAVVLKLFLGDRDIFGVGTTKDALGDRKDASASYHRDKKGSPGKPSVEENPNIEWEEHLAAGIGKFEVLTDNHIKYKEGKRFLLVIAGHVFDVSSASKMYEKGSGYHGFIGRDGTRAFVTGKFDDEGLIPDLNGLEPADILGVSGWINFYLNKYKFVGVHRGTFFDENGMPTENMRKFQEDVAKAKQTKFEEEEKDKVFPSCNMEWSASLGSRLWCTRKSGGIDREWTGVPRVLKEPGKDGRCACVPDGLLDDPRLAEYDGCPPDSVECRLKE